jgi:hypothetical protein
MAGAPAHCSVMLQHAGGASGRIAAAATAFPNRDALHWIAIGTAGTRAELTPGRMDVVRSAWHRIEPFSNGLYTNSIMDEDATRIRRNFGARHARLLQVKQHHDPRNQFRLNANVVPGRGAAVS